MRSARTWLCDLNFVRLFPNFSITNYSQNYSSIIGAGPYWSCAQRHARHVNFKNRSVRQSDWSFPISENETSLRQCCQYWFARGHGQFLVITPNVITYRSLLTRDLCWQSNLWFTWGFNGICVENQTIDAVCIDVKMNNCLWRLTENIDSGGS